MGGTMCAGKRGGEALADNGACVCLREGEGPAVAGGRGCAAPSRPGLRGASAPAPPPRPGGECGGGGAAGTGRPPAPVAAARPKFESWGRPGRRGVGLPLPAEGSAAPGTAAALWRLRWRRRGAWGSARLRGVPRGLRCAACRAVGCPGGVRRGRGWRMLRGAWGAPGLRSVECREGALACGSARGLPQTQR